MTLIKTYLENCCEEYQLMGCVVTGENGLVLACVGDHLDDGCAALLPHWLEIGEKISMKGDLDGMSCCCLMPKNQSAMILAWEVVGRLGNRLYFAIRTRHIPRNVTAVLESIGKDVDLLIAP